jgi:hypothetical protein
VNQALSTPVELQRGAAEVVHWRFERLLEAGYESETASWLAKHVDIDLHLAVRLVQDGCPPDTALSILA